MKNTSYHTGDARDACTKKLKMKFTNVKAWFTHKDKKVGIVIIHPGRKPLPKGTYKSIAAGLRISTEQLDGLLECTFGYKEYLKTQHLEE